MNPIPLTARSHVVPASQVIYIFFRVRDDWYIARDKAELIDAVLMDRWSDVMEVDLTRNTVHLYAINEFINRSENKCIQKILNERDLSYPEFD